MSRGGLYHRQKGNADSNRSHMQEVCSFPQLFVHTVMQLCVSKPSCICVCPHTFMQVGNMRLSDLIKTYRRQVVMERLQTVGGGEGERGHEVATDTLLDTSVPTLPHISPHFSIPQDGALPETD